MVKKVLRYFMMKRVLRSYGGKGFKLEKVLNYFMVEKGFRSRFFYGKRFKGIMVKRFQGVLVEKYFKVFLW